MMGLLKMKYVVFLIIILVGCSMPNCEKTISESKNLMAKSEYQKAGKLLQEITKADKCYAEAQVLILKSALLGDKESIDFWKQAELIASLDDAVLKDLEEMLYSENEDFMGASQLILSKMDLKGEAVLKKALASDKSKTRIAAIAGLSQMDAYKKTPDSIAHRKKIIEILKKHKEVERDDSVIKELDEHIQHLLEEINP